MLTIIKILAFYLPLQLALNPSSGIDLASIRVFILLIFFLWVAEGLRKRKLEVPLNTVTFLLLLFLFISGISFFWAENQDWAMRKILFLLSIFPLYFVITDTVKEKTVMGKISSCLVCSGSVVAIMGIFQFFLQFIFSIDSVYNFWARNIAPIFLGSNVTESVLRNPSWLVNVSGHTFFRATGTFPDPHMFSLFLGMLIPLSAGLYLKAKKNIFLVSLVVMLIADFLTFSRGGYLGLLAGAVFLLIILWKKVSIRYKLFFSGFIIAIGLLFIVPGPIASRFSSIFNLNEGSNAGRLNMWEKSWKVAMDNPFLGVGLGNYPLEIKPSASYREPITAHNTYLDIASETGIINAAIWMMLLISTILIFLKKSKADNFFLMPAVSIVIFSAHQIAETAIYSPVVLTLFVIILGLTNVREN